jgi:UPF0755 protein
MRPVTKIILGVFFFALLIFTAITMQWLEFARKPLPVPPEGVLIDYYPGDSVSHFAKKMEREKLIKHAWFYVLLARMEGADRHLVAGQYRIMPNTTPPMLLEKMIKGDVVQHLFRIGEGWTVNQVIQMVNQNNDFKHSEPLPTADSIKASLGLNEVSLEGWLYPDTYFLPINAEEMNLFKRAYAKMQHILQEEWDARAPNLLYKTPEEALIMASIIEKETGVPDERSKVAGVFLRRLQKNMLLQADPTIIYGLQDKYQGKLTKENLTTPTPYNTYTQLGLPPTPICIPSRASIHAALHPDDSDNLYFVAKGDGKHVFNSNLTDHNAAVKKYQLQNNNNTTNNNAPASVPASAPAPVNKGN